LPTDSPLVQDLTKGNAVVDRLKEFYMDYGLRIKERMQDVLGTLVNATQKED
jgi:hypothetical protein